MAKARRVVRKVEAAGNPYFDEQLWPVQIALVVLGGFLMGVSLAYQPLAGDLWYRTAWPSLIGTPLVVIAAMVALSRIDNRLVRRSLQLSLVLCAILHVALVVQMVQTQLFSGVFRNPRKEPEVREQRPLKIVPEYHPTQLVPDEDRPRQDFEKPVAAETPEPQREPEKIVRQPTTEEQSPAEPQPTPVPEQQRTTEPNVVNRQKPNETVPRLAAQTSRLSRQTQPSQSRMSQPVEVPAAVHEQAAAAEVRPSATAVQRQQAESAAKSRIPAEPSANGSSRESQLARRTTEALPTNSALATKTAPRSIAEPAAAAQTPIAAAAPATTSPTDPVELQPSSTTASRQTAAATPATPARAAPGSTPKPTDVPVAAARRSETAADKASPSVATVMRESAPPAPRRAAAPTTANHASVALDSPTQPNANASQGNAPAQPASLAISRAESGVAGSRRSPNLDTSLVGGSSPALAASSAARRAEATQEKPAGDALSPAAVSRIARSRSSATVPTTTVKAEQLETATAAGAAQLAEVTASSGASMTRSDAAARHDAVTAAKGAGEIDFGPTQVVTEAGSGRASGGGQPQLHLSAPSAPAARRSSAGGMPLAASSSATADDVAAPAGAGSTSSPMVEASPGAAAPGRTDGGSAASSAVPSLAANAVPATESNVKALAGAAPVVRMLRREDAPVTGQSAAGEAGSASSAALAHRAPATAAAGGAAEVANIPDIGPMSAVAQAESDHIATGAAKTAVARTRGEALAVDIEAPTGPGGLGADFTPEVGINTRQARSDSTDVQLRAARFLRSQVGGLPAVSTAAVIPTEAFSSRAARVRGQQRAGGSGSPSPQTEEAIERGLAFLARYQLAEGGWSLQGFPEGASLVSDTAATALAVLSFQGAGYNHREFQYKDVVRAGIAHLLKSQKENGDLFIPLDDASNGSVWLYSHSIAALAICEAYGMTQDPALREPAQKAIDFIVAGQQAERGGWRYAPGVGADTSVTGWMMMALKSGELAGLNVAPATYRKIDRWLDDAQQSRSEPHLYRYNPYAYDTPEQRHGRVASKTMTAVGLLMRLYTGWRRDNPNMIRGAGFLAENLPAQGTARDPQRDTYYWYYATQVMVHVGGQPWQAWMSRLHPLLVDSQVRQGVYAGSWDPRAPIADRWGVHAGRLYVTTMNLLSLEVQYRKLPLYEDVAK